MSPTLPLNTDADSRNVHLGGERSLRAVGTFAVGVRKPRSWPVTCRVAAGSRWSKWAESPPSEPLQAITDPCCSMVARTS
jgi:hypothetical protein